MKFLLQLWAFVTELMGELSDENAYARHLKMTGCAHSPSEWRSFIDRRHRAKYQNPKCC
jgi:hypothetical protein